MPRDQETVHKTMSAIRGKNTGIERKLRSALTKEGIHYRLYSSKVIGHPDILIESLRIAIFCDSEFWHGFHYEENIAKVKTNQGFWIAKIQRNMARDELVNEELKKQGYRVLRFWGQQIEKDIDSVVATIKQAIKERTRVLELRKKICQWTTLAYLEKDGCYLMLHRDKKEHDPNEGKWIGVGGHVEAGESIPACLKREIREETGLTVTKYRYLGKVDFIYEGLDPERMYVYAVPGFEGEMIPCNEGTLAWIKKEEIPNLSLWEGDRIFMPLMEGEDIPFELVLYYQDGELLDVLGPFAKKKGKKPCKKTKRK